MKLKRQLAWPCHDCAVRATNFCSTLISRTPTAPSAATGQISQAFFTAEKSETIRSDKNGPSFGPYVLCEGWAFRFHRFPDGRRQILSVLIPGDLFFTAALGNLQPDFSVQPATDIRFCELNRTDIRREIAGKPGAIDALGKVCMQEGEDLVAVTINFTEQNAATRIKNFARRIVARLAARDIQIAADIYPFPPTNIDIADATGLTADDVNRAIQFLRADGIIDLSNGELTILDPSSFEGRPPALICHDLIRTISHSEIRLL